MFKNINYTTKTNLNSTFTIRCSIIIYCMFVLHIISHRPVGHESRRTPESFNDNDIVSVIIIIIVRLSVHEMHNGASIYITYGHYDVKQTIRIKYNFTGFHRPTDDFVLLFLFFFTIVISVYRLRACIYSKNIVYSP